MHRLHTSMHMQTLQMGGWDGAGRLVVGNCCCCGVVDVVPLLPSNRTMGRRRSAIHASYKHYNAKTQNTNIHIETVGRHWGCGHCQQIRDAFYSEYITPWVASCRRGDNVVRFCSWLSGVTAGLLSCGAQPGHLEMHSPSYTASSIVIILFLLSLYSVQHCDRHL